MNRIEHVFKLGRQAIKTPFRDRTQELRGLLDVLEKTAQVFPKKVFYDNKNWFFNEDDQTRNDWGVIGTMLEALEIYVQNRELGLFGFYSLELPKEAMLGNFNFLREILPAPEETKFEIQKVNPGDLQALGSHTTYFNFGDSTLEVRINTALVLSNDEIENLSNYPYKNKTVWETICSHAFACPIKYIVTYSRSTHLTPKGKIEKKYSAQINLVRKGNFK